MDKQTIIKIAIAVIIAIFAIAYYFSSHKESENYDNLLAESVVANITTEEVVEEKSTIKVYVTGEVNNPGVIELEEGSRIQDAIEGAGGIKSEANLKDVNLAYEVEDGEKIYIPNQSEESTEAAESTGMVSENSSGSSSNAKGKININKATASELTAIPGVGESTAQKIVAYREENGKFKTIEDIKNVSGIGDNKFNNIKDYIAVK